MIRFYLLPVVETLVGSVTMRNAKYRESVAAINNGIWMDFGYQDVFLIVADTDATEHAFLIAQSDVSAFPVDFDSTLGAQRNAVETALEGYGIPANWLTTGMAYRTVLRTIIGMFKIAQAFHEISTSGGGTGKLLPAGVTMATQYQNMPEPYRTHLQQAIDRCKYDRSMLSGTSTLRTLLRVIGQQQAPGSFLGVTV